MFSDQLQQISSSHNSNKPARQKLSNYEGVDLSEYQCYQLKPDPIFSAYENSDVHYAIGAIQKGLKPPTKVGLKRMKRRNHQKLAALKIKIQNEPQYIQQLNPKSPEAICMKALRRKFKEQIAPTAAQDEKKSKSADASSVIQNRIAPKPKPTQEQKNARRRPKFIRKKENQLKRRIELITLVEDNKKVLLKIFGRQKLKGHNHKSKCPKISRQEVKAALVKYYEKKAKEYLEKVRVINDFDELRMLLDEKQKERERVREERRVEMEKREKEKEESGSSVSSSGDSESEQSSVSPVTP